MKLEWKDVQPYFFDAMILTDGQDQYWYQYVWQILVDSSFTIYNSFVEKLAVYSKVYALAKILNEFYDICLKGGSDFDIYFNVVPDDDTDFDKYIDSDEKSIDLEGIFNELIYGSSTIKTILGVLKEKLGIAITFCSMWIIFYSEDIEITPDDYEAFDAGEHIIYSYEKYCNIMEGLLNGEYKFTLDGIVNFSLTGDKLYAFQWLDNQM